jgi:hypothetical protein
MWKRSKITRGYKYESGQKLKLDNMNEWYMVNLPN